MTDTDHGSTGSAETITDKARTAAEGLSNDVKTRAQDAANTVASEAANYADQAKGAAADEVEGVASALRTAAREMRSGSPQERTMSQIAEGLADASDAMRDKDLGEMVGLMTDFAKRNPIIFLGGAALIGFAATRFAKASTPAGGGSSPYETGLGDQPTSASGANRPYVQDVYGAPPTAAHGGTDA